MVSRRAAPSRLARKHRLSRRAGQRSSDFNIWPAVRTSQPWSCLCRIFATSLQAHTTPIFYFRMRHLTQSRSTLAQSGRLATVVTDAMTTTETDHRQKQIE
ncbi:hypothetical protein EVAR_6248_1 [Eumeta japonica]|uniref:Uncharacterized protein n=1 Tax=Eumeta variegata TaxID=151549 RepID=A0A4C1T8D6_EUMVA|nr:hypothetical protein EVAR_6248_1 [Eumeta japonica]